MQTESSWQGRLWRLAAEQGSRLQLTRFAPSPTGPLHLGHLVNAALVWGLADRYGSRILLRIEDHDRSRCREPFVDGIREDLAAFEFAWDLETRQRDQEQRYQKALEQLRQQGLIYRCRCTRKTLQQEPGEASESRYPGTCKTQQDHISADEPHSLRCVMPDRAEIFHDAFLGKQEQNPQAQCGDIVVFDRHGQWTYQFAVVVDDMVDGVDLIVRGQDILPSTGRQLSLRRYLLGIETIPVFFHHPLLHDPGGKKLSKRDLSTSLRSRLDAGEAPEHLIGEALFKAGFMDQSRAVKRTELQHVLEQKLS